MMTMFVASVMLYDFSKSQKNENSTPLAGEPIKMEEKSPIPRETVEKSPTLVEKQDFKTPEIREMPEEIKKQNGKEVGGLEEEKSKSEPKLTSSRSVLERLREEKFTTPVVGMQNFGVKLRPTPPKK